MAEIKFKCTGCRRQLPGTSFPTRCGVQLKTCLVCQKARATTYSRRVAEIDLQIKSIPDAELLQIYDNKMVKPPSRWTRWGQHMAKRLETRVYDIVQSNCRAVYRAHTAVMKQLASNVAAKIIKRNQMPNAWVIHVKRWAAAHDTAYGCAISNADCRAAYTKVKGAREMHAAALRDPDAVVSSHRRQAKTEEEWMEEMNAEVRPKRVPKIKTSELKDKAVEVMHHFGLTPGRTSKAKRDQIQIMLYEAARAAVLEGPRKPRGVDMNDYAFSLIDVHALIAHALRA